MTTFMYVMSFIGGAGCYVPVLAAVLWCVNPRAGAGAAVLITISGALNVLLKITIHAPRPFWTDPSITPHESLDSFGMPSGHAQGATVAYGLLAVLIWRRARGAPGRRPGLVAAAAAVVLVAVIVLVGVSRVYLGVHSVGQVLAGWLIGATLLLAAMAFRPVVVPWWLRRSPAIQLGLGLAVALAFLVPTAAAVSQLRSWRWPTSWAQAIEAAGGSVGPITLTDGAGVAGLLFGVLAGLSLLARRGWFEPHGTPWRRLARVPVGAGGAGMIALGGWLIVGSTAGASGTPAAIAVFACAAGAGAWLAGGAPEAFVGLGLATRRRGEAERTRELVRDGQA
ncbi:MAG TPA: phosphatase PAP2 family protein [Streptosporangiaceae bacterium]|nr:phosphatase PAP2 family protein [Streptosporangiaceae bacterium]